MIKTLLVTIFVAAIAEQADLVFRDGGNSCTIFKTEGTRTVHSQCDFHSPNVDAEVQDLKERMTSVEARLPATPAPTEPPTQQPTHPPTDSPTFLPWQGTCTALATCTEGKGEVTTLAGNGKKAFTDGTDCAASFNNPMELAYSPDGSTLAVADRTNNRIRQIELATGEVTTLAGSGSLGSADGIGIAASFNTPWGLDYSPDGKTVAVSETEGNVVRLIEVATGKVTTLAGNGQRDFADGIGSAAMFNQPSGLSFSKDGKTLAVAEYSGNRVRLINIATAAVTTLAGQTHSFNPNGYKDSDVGSEAWFHGLVSLSYSPDDSTIAVADAYNNRIRMIDVATGAVSTLAGGNPQRYGAGNDQAWNDNLGSHESAEGYADGIGIESSFSHPLGLDYSPDGKTIAVADSYTQSIRLITVATGAVTTLAGNDKPCTLHNNACQHNTGYIDGIGHAAKFFYPQALTFSNDGRTIVVSDTENSRLREICV